MGILRGFFSEDLAIDLGTVNTIVYAPTQGVVLNEPSVLALHKYSGEVISVGTQALKLLGREPNDTEVHRPIRRGAIDNFEISQKFLRALISRVQHNDHPKRSHLVIGVPGSMARPWLIPHDEARLSEAIQKQAKELVDQAAAKLRSHHKGLKIIAKTFRGSASRVIVEAAKRYKIDLIVLGSHGHSRWERLLLGSVAHAIALHADCSVEIVRRKRRRSN
jgi:nucleotide-binding universal stress UspA family protein